MKDKMIKEKFLIKVKRNIPNKLSSPTVSTIMYTDIDEIKKNLDDMTIYISQHLELTTMKKIFFLINKDYPEGAFAVKDRSSLEIKYNVIVQQTILNYMREVFQLAYIQANMEQNWKWKITDLTNVTINNLTDNFFKHLKTCKIEYQAIGNNLTYIMDYFIIIKLHIQGKEKEIISSKSFNFIVKAIN